MVKRAKRKTLRLLKSMDEGIAMPVPAWIRENMKLRKGERPLCSRCASSLIRWDNYVCTNCNAKVISSIDKLYLVRETG
jgi:predicted amidophosphoribosyltransferase